MEQDFDYTDHPKHHLLDRGETKKTTALVPMKPHNFLCAYHSRPDQDSSSKNEMN